MSLSFKLLVMVAGERVVAWLEEFEERAGIMEFCGGLTRDCAEAEALRILGPKPIDKQSRFNEGR